MTCRNFQVFRVLGCILRIKAQVDSRSRGQNILFVEKRRERLHGVMQGDQETGGPMGQVGNWVFVTFLYCPRVELSLRCKQKFPGKEKCLSLANYHLLGPPAVRPSNWLQKLLKDLFQRTAIKS
jgi:hypothetical protein